MAYEQHVYVYVMCNNGENNMAIIIWHVKSMAKNSVVMACMYGMAESNNKRQKKEGNDVY